MDITDGSKRSKGSYLCNDPGVFDIYNLRCIIINTIIISTISKTGAYEKHMYYSLKWLISLDSWSTFAAQTAIQIRLSVFGVCIVNLQTAIDRIKRTHCELSIVSPLTNSLKHNAIAAKIPSSKRFCFTCDMLMIRI